MLNLIHHTVVRAGRDVTSKLLAVTDPLATETARVFSSAEDVRAGPAGDLGRSLCQGVDREVGTGHVRVEACHFVLCGRVGVECFTQETCEKKSILP